MWRGGGAAGRPSGVFGAFPDWELAKRFAMKLDILGIELELAEGVCWRDG